MVNLDTILRPASKIGDTTHPRSLWEILSFFEDCIHTCPNPIFSGFDCSASVVMSIVVPVHVTLLQSPGRYKFEISMMVYRMSEGYVIRQSSCAQRQRLMRNYIENVLQAGNSQIPTCSRNRNDELTCERSKLLVRKESVVHVYENMALPVWHGRSLLLPLKAVDSHQDEDQMHWTNLRDGKQVFLDFETTCGIHEARFTNITLWIIMKNLWSITYLLIIRNVLLILCEVVTGRAALEATWTINHHILKSEGTKRRNIPKQETHSCWNFSFKHEMKVAQHKWGEFLILLVLQGQGQLPRSTRSVPNSPSSMC